MPCVSVKHIFAARANRKVARAAKKASKASIARPRTSQHLKGEEILRVPRGKRVTRADLINAESRLGSQIFGPVPAGHRREFFHDRQNIWIWHEDWTEADRRRQLTVRYEVRKTGVYKKISAGSYFKLQGAELENFRRAAHTYLRVVKTYLYN